MPHFALSAIGRDRPGIVAAVTGVLLDHELNVEDSQMTILRGHFSMVLVLAARPDLDRAALDADLERVAGRLELEGVAVREVGGLEGRGAEPTHIVTIYGLDHPGIVHAAAQAMADRGVSITDLNTRLLEEEGGALYVLMMELALPSGTEPGELETALHEVGRHEGVEVTLRELEQDEL